MGKITQTIRTLTNIKNKEKLQKPLIHRIREHLRTLMNKRLFHFVLWWRRGDYTRIKPYISRVYRLSML